MRPAPNREAEHGFGIQVMGTKSERGTLAGWGPEYDRAAASSVQGPVMCDPIISLLHDATVFGRGKAGAPCR